MPSKQKAKVESLFNTDRNVNKIHEGQAVTIKVDREIDISRGCVIVKDTSLKVSDTFKSTVLWMDDTELMEEIFSIKTRYQISTSHSSKC